MKWLTPVGNPDGRSCLRRSRRRARWTQHGAEIGFKRGMPYGRPCSGGSRRRPDEVAVHPGHDALLASRSDTVSAGSGKGAAGSARSVRSPSSNSSKCRCASRLSRSRGIGPGRGLARRTSRNPMSGNVASARSVPAACARSISCWNSPHERIRIDAISSSSGGMWSSSVGITALIRRSRARCR